MDTIIFFILISVLKCDAWSSREIMNIARRADFDFDRHDSRTIIGAPSYPNHLPEAEPILPGHTLLRPAMGMLKSAIKFPHRELESGFGVNGNIDNLGIRYDGKNERVLYSGFRRMPADYVMVVPEKKHRYNNPVRFSLASLVLDTDRKDEAQKRILKKFKEINKPIPRKLQVYISKNPKKQLSSLVDYLASLNKKKKSTSSKSRDKYSYYILPPTVDTKTSVNPNYIRNILLNLRRDKDRDDDANENNTKNGDSSETYVPIHMLKPLSSSNKTVGKAHESEDDLYNSEQDEKYLYLPLHQDISEEEKVRDKSKWLLKSKHMFDNIVISPDAPDFDKFIPTEPPNRNTRNWWFYNQMDLTNLENEK